MIIMPQKPTFHPDGHISIKLNISDVDYSTIEKLAKQQGYRQQDSPHITIVGSKAKDFLNQKLTQLSEAERTKLIEQISQLLSNFKWQYTTTDIYHIEKIAYFQNNPTKEHRKSYVQLIDMPEIQQFYDQLNKILDTSFQAQLPHITLFTKGETGQFKYYGIPIASVENFQTLNPQKIT